MPVLYNTNTTPKGYTDIPNFKDEYCISKNGDVYSKHSNKSIVHDINPKNKIHGVRLFKDGKGYRFSVARLMAITFIPNPKRYKYAIHTDGDMNNLSVENIMWGTPSTSANRKHNRYPDLFKGRKIVCTPKKMDDTLLDKFYGLLQEGHTVKEIDAMRWLPIGKNQMWNILKRDVVWEKSV